MCFPNNPNPFSHRIHVKSYVLALISANNRHQDPEPSNVQARSENHSTEQVLNLDRFDNMKVATQALLFSLSDTHHTRSKNSQQSFSSFLTLISLNACSNIPNAPHSRFVSRFSPNQPKTMMTYEDLCRYLI